MAPAAVLRQVALPCRKLDQCLFLFFDFGLAALARRFAGIPLERVGVVL
jgi:hypothetical protein